MGQPVDGEANEAAHQQEAQYEHEQVHGHARDGDLQIVPAQVAVVARVHRHRLGPAKAQQQHHDRADGSQMPGGVHGESAQHARGGVAAAVGHPGVGELVQRERHEAARDGEQQEDQHLPGIIKKGIEVAEQGLAPVEII